MTSPKRTLPTEMPRKKGVTLPEAPASPNVLPTELPRAVPLARLPDAAESMELKRPEPNRADWTLNLQTRNFTAPQALFILGTLLLIGTLVDVAIGAQGLLIALSLVLRVTLFSLIWTQPEVRAALRPISSLGGAQMALLALIAGVIGIDLVTKGAIVMGSVLLIVRAGIEVVERTKGLASPAHPALQSSASEHALTADNAAPLLTGLNRTESQIVIHARDRLNAHLATNQRLQNSQRSYEAKAALERTLPETIEAYRLLPPAQRDPGELQRTLNTLVALSTPDRTGDIDRWETQKRFIEGKKDEQESALAPGPLDLFPVAGPGLSAAENEPREPQERPTKERDRP